jgi:alpha-1,6-mannosyltransferase
MFYGERSGGIRTYLDAKARWALSTGAVDHHVVVPRAHERHEDGRHELPSLRVATANGYRLPLGPEPSSARCACCAPTSCSCTIRSGCRAV